MAQTDKTPNPATVGREQLHFNLTRFAAAHDLERAYQTALSDLKTKECFEGISGEVAELSVEGRESEMMGRVLLLVIGVVDPNARMFIASHLYMYFRAAGVMDAVKPDLAARLVTAKGAPSS